MKSDREIAELRARLLALDRERQQLQIRLVDLTAAATSDPHPRSSEQVSGVADRLTNTSPVAAKVTLFRRLFAGRKDVYPVRWENAAAQKSGYAPACSNEWRRGVCAKPQVKCTECPNQAFVAVSDEIIENHLRGEVRSGGRTAPFVAGVYPILPDDTCWFLAMDFDGEHWSRDALAVIAICRAERVPAAWNARVQDKVAMSGSSSASLWSRETRVSWERCCSRPLSNAGRKSDSIRMTDCFRARTRFQEEGWVT